MKRKLLLSGVIMIYLLLIIWTIDFMVLSLLDVKIVSALLFGTLFFYMTTVKKTDTKPTKLRLLQWQSQIAAIIITLLLEMKVLSHPLDFNTLSNVIYHLRPLFYSGLIYLVLETYIRNLKRENPSDSNNPHIRKLLTKREADVYDLILKGYDNNEIANELYIAVSTVKKHIQNILRKTECKSKEALIYKSQRK